MRSPAIQLRTDRTEHLFPANCIKLNTPSSFNLAELLWRGVQEERRLRNAEGGEVFEGLKLKGIVPVQPPAFTVLQRRN
jgi:hypothetical protein